MAAEPMFTLLSLAKKKKSLYTYQSTTGKTQNTEMLKYDHHINQNNFSTIHMD